MTVDSRDGVKPGACPYCGKPHDAATFTGPENHLRPVAGDWSVCLDCCQIGKWTADGGVRALSDGEKWEAARLPALRKVVAAMREWNAKGRPSS